MRALAILAVLAAPAIAHADDEIVKGTIVKIEAQEIYVDIGAGKGVTHGASVRIKRGASLRHPVTRALVQDWLPIGSATVTQAGSDAGERSLAHRICRTVGIVTVWPPWAPEAAPSSASGARARRRFRALPPRPSRRPRAGARAVRACSWR